MQILPSKDSEPLDRGVKDARGARQKSDSITIRQENPGSIKHDAETGLSTSGRLGLRSQRVLDGLGEVAALLREKIGDKEAQGRLESIIRQARFQDERILDEYGPQLKEIVRARDMNRLLLLTDETRQKILHYAKNETISQNMAALESRDPKALVREIAKNLRQRGLPSLVIERSRVMDLLNQD
ncbi:MAG: hypothetical protein EHM28_08875 [Spirochaetaceae bacterium]|nr:MAG: hypothetical protein EHM28_08875 [Spirochaetaceae bacterium]